MCFAADVSFWVVSNIILKFHQSFISVGFLQETIDLIMLLNLATYLE